MEHRDHAAAFAMSKRMRLKAELAEQSAMKILEQGDFDLLGIMRILRMIVFPMSSIRKNAIPPGVKKIQGQLFGMHARRGGVGITTATDECPHTIRLLAAWLRTVDAEFQFMSIQVNRNYASRPHVDKNNLGMSYIVSLGRFTGGEICVHGEGARTTNDHVRELVFRLRG